MNIIREQIKAIFGDQLPEGATSFHTAAGLCVFLIGKTGEFVDVEMTPEQVEQMRAAKLLGSLGYQMQ